MATNTPERATRAPSSIGIATTAQAVVTAAAAAAAASAGEQDSAVIREGDHVIFDEHGEKKSIHPVLTNGCEAALAQQSANALAGAVGWRRFQVGAACAVPASHAGAPR